MTETTTAEATRDRLAALIARHRFCQLGTPHATAADKRLWDGAAKLADICQNIDPPAAAAEPPAHDVNARHALHDIGRAIGHPFTLGTTAAHMRDTILQRLGIQPNNRLPEPIPPRPISLADPRPRPETAGDPVNHPTHYTRGPIEVIEIVEGFGLGFRLGNVVKYCLRAGHKDGVPPLVDLRKAVWYLTREIQTLEQATAATPDTDKATP